MYCKQCGQQLTDGAKFCKYCGSEQNVRQTELKNDRKRADGTKRKVPIVGIAAVAAVTVIVIVLGTVGFRLLRGRKIILPSKEITQGYEDGEEVRKDISTYKYDEIERKKGGEIVVEGSWKYGGSGKSSVEYVYDDERNKIKDTRYDEDGGLVWANKYEYDKYGNCVKEKHKMDDLEYEYKCTVNKYGIFEKTIWLDKSSDTSEPQITKYDVEYEERDILRRPTKVIATADDESYVEYTLKGGKVIRREIYSADGEPASEIKYDENGNIIEQTIYSDGEIFSRTKYEYEEYKVK